MAWTDYPVIQQGCYAVRYETWNPKPVVFVKLEPRTFVSEFAFIERIATSAPPPITITQNPFGCELTPFSLKGPTLELVVNVADAVKGKLDILKSPATPLNADRSIAQTLLPSYPLLHTTPP